MALAHRLAEFVAGLTHEKIPAHVRERAKQHLMDWMGCTLAAHAEKPALILRELARELGGPVCATVVAYGDRTSALNAALVNGAISHVVEYDDIDKDSVYHPSCPVVAAALAASEMAGADGKALVTGVVAGYEVSTRIGRAIQPSHYRYWHTTATVGAFGAAAAAASVCGLTAEQAAHAVGLAATQAAGLGEVMAEENMAKPFHAGKAAYNGLLSVLMARRGYTAASTMLEGGKGFLKAMSLEPRYERVTDALGERWHTIENTYKYYGSCGHTHAAVDCAQAIRAQGVAAEDIESVDVFTYSEAVKLTDKVSPKSVYEARFSTQYCVAVAFIDGTVGYRQMRPERIADPAIHALAARVKLHADPEADRVFPGERHASVIVRTRDGRTLRHHVEARKGDPANPITPAELEEKFASLAGLRYTPERAHRLREAIRTIDQSAAGFTRMIEILREGAER